jgi:hypothetical protein
VVALLALGMLAIIPGTIAGSALTKSAKQVPNVEVPNVATQISAAYCGYITGGDWGQFGSCMMSMLIPTELYFLGSMAKGGATIWLGKKVTEWGVKRGFEDIVSIGKSLVRTGSYVVRFSVVGALVVGA